MPSPTEYRLTGILYCDTIWESVLKIAMPAASTPINQVLNAPYLIQVFLEKMRSCVGFKASP
jgi:hypothetical protein